MKEWFAKIGKVPVFDFCIVGLGENDASAAFRYNDYQDNQTKLNRRLRSVTTNWLHIYLIKCSTEEADDTSGRGDGQMGGQSTVRTAQDTVANAQAYTHTYQPTTLSPAIVYTEASPNGIHFDMATLEQMGVELANQIAPKTLVLGGGQSNIGNYSSGSYDSAGETALVAALEAGLPGLVTYIDGAEGGSYLSKKAYDISGLSNDEYWVDDTDPSSSNWSAGPELTDFYNAVTVAGSAHTDVTEVLWGQGESDSNELRPESSPSITEAEYKEAMEWLFDDIRSTFANLRGIYIQMIAKHTADKTGGFQRVREPQQEVTSENADVYLGAEVYDQTLSDTVHLDKAGYTVAGNRAGNSIAKGARGGTAAARGPSFSSASVSGKTLTINIQHEKGTSLSGAKASSGDQAFRIYQGSWDNGTEIAIDTVTVGDSTITIGLVDAPVDDITIYYPFDSVDGVTDSDAFIKDNTADQLPLQSFAETVTFNAAASAAAIVALADIIGYFNADDAADIDDSASAGEDVWTNQVGSGNNAYRDGSDPSPTYAADALSSGYAGLVSDGSASIKLLFEHSMTVDSSATMIVVATPESDGTDPTTGSSLNTIITTGGIGSNSALLAIGQNRTTPGEINFTGHGSTGVMDGSPFAKSPQVFSARVDDTNFGGWINGVADGSNGAHSGTAVVDDTNSDGTGTPLIALFNDVDKPTGADSVRAFLGAIHEVLIFDAVLSDTQRLLIEKHLITKFSIS